MLKATNMYVDTYKTTPSTRVFSHFLNIASFNTTFLSDAILYRTPTNTVTKNSLSFLDQEAVGLLVVQKVVLRACLDMHVS